MSKPMRAARPKAETSSPEPEFLSRAEVARLFGVSGSTVTRWARTGVLKAIRTPGGHYRFRAAAVRLATAASSADELQRLD